MAIGNTSIQSSSDDSDSDDDYKPSVDKLALAVIFLRMHAINKRLNESAKI